MIIFAERHAVHPCDSQLSKDNNITTGKIYQQVITRERAGEYLGKTVQVPAPPNRTLCMLRHFFLEGARS